MTDMDGTDSDHNIQDMDNTAANGVCNEDLTSSSVQVSKKSSTDPMTMSGVFSSDLDPEYQEDNSYQDASKSDLGGYGMTDSFVHQDDSGPSSEQHDTFSGCGMTDSFMQLENGSSMMGVDHGHGIDEGVLIDFGQPSGSSELLSPDDGARGEAHDRAETVEQEGCNFNNGGDGGMFYYEGKPIDDEDGLEMTDGYHPGQPAVTTNPFATKEPLQQSSSHGVPAGIDLLLQSAPPPAHPFEDERSAEDRPIAIGCTLFTADYVEKRDMQKTSPGTNPFLTTDAEIDDSHININKEEGEEYALDNAAFEDGSAEEGIAVEGTVEGRELSSPAITDTENDSTECAVEEEEEEVTHDMTKSAGQVDLSLDKNKILDVNTSTTQGAPPCEAGEDSNPDLHLPTKDVEDSTELDTEALKQDTSPCVETVTCAVSENLESCTHVDNNIVNKQQEEHSEEIVTGPKSTENTSDLPASTVCAPVKKTTKVKATPKSPKKALSPTKSGVPVKAASASAPAAKQRPPSTHVTTSTTRPATARTPKKEDVAATKTTATPPRPKTAHSFQPSKETSTRTASNGTTQVSSKTGAKASEKKTPTSSPAIRTDSASKPPSAKTTTQAKPVSAHKATTSSVLPSSSTPASTGSPRKSDTKAKADSMEDETQTPSSSHQRTGYKKSDVQSRIGSKDNMDHKPGGGNVKIENRKISMEGVKSKIGSLDNAKHTPKGGDKKIESQKLIWNASSKIGSLENAQHTPRGGDIKIESKKLEWNAQSKIGSLDNAKHIPGGGEKKIESKKLEWKVQSKIGSLENAHHTPGGGDIKIVSVKPEWNALPKIGSLINVHHAPGGGNKKIVSMKLVWNALPKIGSLINVHHVPGGGDKKIETQKLDFKEKATSKIGSLDYAKAQEREKQIDVQTSESDVEQSSA